jgi:hypothetical protein
VTAEPTVIVIVELNDGVPFDGLKPIVTPAGCPLALRSTVWLYPLIAVMLTMAVVELSCWTVPDEGTTEMLKSTSPGVVTVPVQVSTACH